GLYNRNNIVDVRDALFTRNSASISSGGAYNLTSDARYDDTIFHENAAVTSAGGMGNRSSNVQLTNDIFHRNRANNGGAMFNSNGNIRVLNNTIVANQATLGGGIFNAGSTTSIRNTILWNNVNDQLHIASGSVFVMNSDLDGGLPIAATDLGGNINADPLFLNMANPAGLDGLWQTSDDGLQLTPLSPAVDTGTLLGAPPEDILGTPRPQGGGIDMGAYEL
ncbi:MAG: hypothetical protein ACI9G1_002170, partial [Pirellulaceae bacterium]